MKEEPVSLTRRQQQILTLIWQGLSTKAIGRQLGLTVKGVEFHRGKLHKKYQVHHVTGLMAAALKDGSLTL